MHVSGLEILAHVDNVIQQLTKNLVDASSDCAKNADHALELHNKIILRDLADECRSLLGKGR